MNIAWILLGLAVGTTQGGAVGASNQGAAGNRGAVPGLPASGAYQAPSGNAGSPGSEREFSKFDRAAWRGALVAPDLGAREKSFDELVQWALLDRQVEATVRRWSHLKQDPELAWTARLLVREVAREREAGRRVMVFPTQPLAVGPSPGATLQAPRPGAEPGAEPATERSHDATVDGGDAPAGSPSFSKRMRFEIGPEGVRVEVHRMGPAADGVPESVYQAPDFDQLLREHPQLREFLGGARFLSGSGALGDEWLARTLRGETDPLQDLLAAEARDLRTDLLGVQMLELSVGQLFTEDHDLGGGLLVERILPGTIAKVVGLRRGDLLLQLNGEPLGSGADVSRVLRERAPEAPLVVKLDREGELMTLTWRPLPAPRGLPSEAAPEREGEGD